MIKRPAPPQLEAAATSAEPGLPWTSLRGPWPAWAAYTLAVGLPLATLLLRSQWGAALDQRPLLLLFVLPILLCTCLGGLGPGLVATGAAAAGAAYFLLPPVASFRIAADHDLVPWGVLVFSGVALSGLGGALRRARGRAAVQERYLAATWASLDEPLVFADAQGRVSFLNDLALELAGWTRAEARGRAVTEVFRPGSPAAAGRLAEWLAGGGAPGFGPAGPWPLVSREGRETPVLWSGTAIRDQAGRQRGAVLIFRDYSAQKRAQDVLRLSEAQLRESHAVISGLMEHSRLLAVYLDRGGSIIWVNRAFAEAHGQEPTHFAGQSFCQLYPAAELPALFQRVMDTAEPAYLAGKPLTLPEGPGLGGRFWDWSLHPVSDPLGRVNGLVLTLAEVTEYKRMEAALRAETQRRAALLERSPDGIVVLDREHKVVEANQRFADLLGYTREELGALSEGDWDPGRGEAALKADFLAIAQEGRVYETRFRKKDGSSLAVEVSAGGAQVGGETMIQAICRDLTPRRQAELARRESEERYQTLFELATDALLLYERDSLRILEANRAASQLFGYTQAEMRTMRGSDLSHEPAATQAAVRDGQLRVPRRVARRKDGALFPVEIAVSFLTLGGREVMLAALRDCSVREKAQQERDALEGQLHQAQKLQAVGTLAGGMAHEFNNLLATILAYAEMVQEAAPPGEQAADDLACLVRAALHGRDLVRRLLNFGRSGQPVTQTLDLNRELREAGEMLARLIPKMVTLELSLDPQVAGVACAAVQLHQMLVNLAGNAVDAMPQGGRLSISTAHVELPPTVCSACGASFGGPLVRLAVRDTGQGMDQETLQKVFEPFYTTKPLGRGTGLGLPMVHGILQNYGGHLVCRSQPGEGTSLELYLPQDQAPAETGSPAPAASGSDLGGAETILWVDDEPSLLDLGSRMLRRQGYRVLTAASGEEALEVFQRQGAEIDLTLLDLGMPGRGGLWSLRELKRLAPRAKVIVISGYLAEERRQEAREAGAAAYLDKPLQKGELLTVVRRVLDRK
ncbi:MAG: PAS domain S-box protein [Deltaproteobacteria bacterium]|nr:PAS domain S-box protein [Deltaproteobacteria bacterium]